MSSKTNASPLALFAAVPALFAFGLQPGDGIVKLLDPDIGDGGSIMGSRLPLMVLASFKAARASSYILLTA